MPPRRTPAGRGAPMRTAEITATVDNRGTPCAVGLIRAAEQIRMLGPGQVLQILTRDRFAPMEVPLWAERDGHTVTAVEQVGRWPRKHFRFLITARPDPR